MGHCFFERKHIAMRKVIVISTLAASLLVAGCQTMDKQTTGTGIGAAGGALAGYFLGGRNALGTTIGALVGAVIGNRIGAYLDEQEKVALAKATNQAVGTGKTGEKIAWVVPGEEGKSKASGWVIPTSDAYAKNNKTCRDIKQVVNKNGEQKTENVTMCKEIANNSKWVIPQSG